MTAALSDKSMRYVSWAGTAIFLALFAFCIARSIHWEIVWDQSVIRYVRFLMSRGLRPYSDITDMNMPGCYLMEAWAMALFGWSDLSWRIYEYVLIAGLTISGMVIGGRKLWFAGIIASTIFLVLRFSEGEAFSLERNEIMALLDFIAVACFFVAVRCKKPWLIGVFSFFACLAASMKPGGLLLEVLLLGLMVLTFRREKVPVGRYLLWALAGGAVVAIIVVSFMLKEHAFGGFFFIVFRVWPMYRGMSLDSPSVLLIHLLPIPLIPVTALAVFAAYKDRDVMQWQRWAFLLAMFSGLVSYEMEGSPVGYHRYVFIAFLAAWIGWEFSLAMQRQHAQLRLAGLLGVAAVFGLVAPYYGHYIYTSVYAGTTAETYPASLQRDLNKLGGNALQGQVECLEMVDGCLRALYENRLVQNTGTTGDLLLFSPEDGPAVDYYRNWYAETQAKNPANVLVLGNHWYQGKGRSFAKIDTWPQYAATIRNMYVPVIERHFGPGDEPAYRIYLRKGSPELTAFQARSLH